MAEFRGLCVLLLLAPAAAWSEESAMKRTRASWDSPEKLVQELRSPREEIRLAALIAAGTPEGMLHRAIHSNESPPKVTGQVVVTPTQVQLRYAALGEDGTQQAILAVLLDDTAVLSVAVSKRGAWERIGVASCWCKYDRTRVLDEFIEVREIAVDRFELILRSSGGGSGLYRQYEEHFRIHGGETTRVLSFVSRMRDFITGEPGGPGPRVKLERRWFHESFRPTGERRWLLVEGEATLPAGSMPAYQGVRDLESRDLKRLRCRTYRWDEEMFRYLPDGPAGACDEADR